MDKKEQIKILIESTKKQDWGFHTQAGKKFIFRCFYTKKPTRFVTLIIEKEKDYKGFEIAFESFGKVSEVLREILEDKKHKGFQVVTGLDAYKYHLEYGNFFHTILASKGITPEQVVPNKDYKMLVQWFDDFYKTSLREFRSGSFTQGNETEQEFRVYFIEQILERRQKEFENNPPKYEAEEIAINTKFIQYLKIERGKSKAILGILESAKTRDTFKEYKDYFEEVYNGYKGKAIKERYLISQIELGEKAMKQLEEDPTVLQFEQNRKRHEATFEFLEYLKTLKTAEEPDQARPPKDKLTHKQQILLLHSIGFFDLSIFSTLTNKQKGILVSNLLNRTEKDSADLIRYFKGKTKEKRFETKTPANIKKVSEILNSIGRGDIKV